MRIPKTVGTLRVAALGSIGLAAIVLASWAWSLGRPARHLAEALRLADRGEPEGALSWLALPESAPATRDRALLLRARLAVDRGRPDEAVGPLNKVDPRGPWAADADFWKGRALYLAKNPKEAHVWFRRVLEKRPGDAEARRWIAAAAYDLGDWPAAVEALTALTQVRPHDPAAWRTLGILYKEENRLDAARRCFETSIARSPEQPAVRLDLAEVLVRSGGFAEAEKQLGLCSGGVVEADRAALLADCARARGDLARAAALLDRALARSPDHAGLLGRRAAIDQARGRDAEAVERLGRALAIDPYNAELHYRRGRSLRVLGRLDESDRDSARAGELNRLVEAISALNKEAVRRPDDAGVRVRLGGLCVLSGRRELAEYWYRAALACDPNSGPAFAGLRELRGPARPGVNPSD